MQTTIEQLAGLVGGKVHGDGRRAIRAARPLSEAGPEDVSFVEDERHLRKLASCRAAALVVPPALVGPAGQGPAPPALIEAADPFAAFVAIATHLHARPEAPPQGIDPRAVVHPSAQVGPDPTVLAYAVVGEGTTIGARCRIHPHVVIGRDCRLGDDVTLHPGVVLYDGTILGNRVTAHAHAVIGADGFSYRFQKGRHVKVPQLGWVEVGDDVEIGAGSCVDRGTFGPTRVGPGTKLDNLVQVAHNCQIGAHNLFAAQVGVAGSSTTGNYVMLGGQAGIADHLTVGDGVSAGAQTGIIGHIPPGQQVFGYPAYPAADMKRMMASLRRLPQLLRDFRALKQQLGVDDQEDPASAA